MTIVPIAEEHIRGYHEAVDSVLLIYGVIPKKFFKNNPAYWSDR